MVAMLHKQELLRMTEAEYLAFERESDVPSIQHYLLISQGKPRVEVFQRQNSGLWTFSDAIGLDASFKIASLEFTLNLADIYEQIQ